MSSRSSPDVHYKRQRKNDELSQLLASSISSTIPSLQPLPTSLSSSFVSSSSSSSFSFSSSSSSLTEKRRRSLLITKKSKSSSSTISIKLSEKDVAEFHRQVDETKCLRYEKERRFLEAHHIRFQVPANYDFTRSTEANYSVKCGDNPNGSHIMDDRTPSVLIKKRHHNNNNKKHVTQKRPREAGEEEGTTSEGERSSSSRSNIGNGTTNELVFVGKYRELRKELDYEFHRHYIPERQLLHDQIIDSFLNNVKVYDAEKQIYCESPLENWIVFTAGTMGAGKGHTMNWLGKHELFPLEAFVKVDPDEIRRFLPETAEYNRLDDNQTGYLTQKEVGYISEVLTIDALNKHRNVLVDGSLRNADWYLEYFKDLRQKFPILKIAIIHVRAEAETVLERARRRSVVTGRVVPEELILESLQAIDRSMEILVPQADFYACIDNEDEGDPMLEYCEMRDRSRLMHAATNNSSSTVNISSTVSAASITSLDESGSGSGGGSGGNSETNGNSGKSESTGISTSTVVSVNGNESGDGGTSDPAIRWCIIANPHQLHPLQGHGNGNGWISGSRGRNRSRSNSCVSDSEDGAIDQKDRDLNTYVLRRFRRRRSNTETSAKRMLIGDEVTEYDGKQQETVQEQKKRKVEEVETERKDSSTEILPERETTIEEELEAFDEEVDWKDHFRQVWVMRCAMPTSNQRNRKGKKQQDR